MITDFSEISKIKLNDFAAIYIGGGNTYSLLQEIKNHNFDKLLKRHLLSGGCIYGGSAGAIILGKSIVTSTDINKTDLKDFRGINLLKGYSVWPHYKESDFEKIKKIALTNKVIAIPETVGIHIKDNSTQIYGQGKVAIFSKNIIRLESKEIISRTLSFLLLILAIGCISLPCLSCMEHRVLSSRILSRLPSLR